MDKKRAILNGRQGFTLIELLVTIAIIGVLATIAITAINYAREKAKIAKAQHTISQIVDAIQVLANDTNEWPGHQTINTVAAGAAATDNEICGADDNAPSNDCGVRILSADSSGLVDNDTYSGWSGPYLRNVQLDPWDNEYFFDTDYCIDIDDNPCGCGGGGDSDAVVIGSYGPDGLGVPTGGITGAYGCDDIIKIITK